MSNANRFGVMLDMSRNAVMKLSELKKFAKLLQSFGYNMIQLYTEDTYEVDDEPYFGHLRGRYSKAELKEFVDYCDTLGIEVIPCIQTLAHLNQIFHHKKYLAINDVTDILLAGDERTYALIENMFKTVRQVFKSEYIHIGMDEAHLLGAGKYLARNGYESRFEILSKHLARVIEIARKYELRPMMWSDMYFRIANHGPYQTLNDVITDEIVATCPDGVELVYWDYYQDNKAVYDNMILQHKKFHKPTWFAGGAWSWKGFAPFNRWSIDTMRLAIESCAEHGVDNVFFTMWGDNGKECSYWSLLPALFAFRKIYDGVTDEEVMKAQFKEVTGEDFDAMMALDLPNQVAPYDGRWSTVSKTMLYNDPLLGIYDRSVNEEAPAQYAEFAKTLRAYGKDSAYAYLFEYEAALCELLSVKYDLGVRARAAYKKGDKQALQNILGDIDRAGELLEAFYRTFKTVWMKENKPFGFEVQDIRLGGLQFRLRAAKETIAAYVNGESDRIEEFDEPVLDPGEPGTAGKAPIINQYNKIATPSVLG